MGESKRRQESLGEDYGTKQQEYLIKGLPITKQQSERFLAVTTQAAWYGIGALVVIWITVRFIGPSLGWWTLLD